MWRVYKHTGTDKDYDACKEALNAATNEVRKSKRNVEHKLARNIKSDCKSFYAKCKCLHAGPGNTGMNCEMGGTILSKTVKEKDLGVVGVALVIMEDGHG